MRKWSDDYLTRTRTWLLQSLALINEIGGCSGGGKVRDATLRGGKM